MAMGRPLKWTTTEEIKPLIETYFKSTPIAEWTITGLALALDTSRVTLIDYCNSSDNGDKDADFSYTIKRAKDMVENSYEIDLKAKGNTWTIFALKNFDWKDKQETENKNLNIETTPQELATMTDEQLQALLK